MSMVPPRGHPTLRRLAPLAVAALLAVLAFVAASLAHPARAAGPAQPSGSPSGWVRVGHLAPTVPAVDITISGLGRPEEEVIRKAGYGAVTPYTTLAPGSYTVAMRPAGAPSTTAPVLSQAVEVGAGSATTLLVFGTGANGTPEVQRLLDDLSGPPAGSGKVRLVQGTAGLPPVQVTAAGGPVLALDLAYGTTTPYTTLPEGRWTLRVQAGDQGAEAAVDVRSGSANTVVVLGSDAGLELRPLVDSTGASSTPVGGVETGGGGTAGAR